MATINKNFTKLAAGYLFPEIAKRTKAFLAQNPGVEILRLGIGNTTEPLTPAVIQGLRRGVEKLASIETYTGYGDEQGDARLREAIAGLYRERGISIDPAEVFVSDGAKPDSANIQSIFGAENVIAVQDPAYPVYVDTNVAAGRSGGFDAQKALYRGFVYMPCNERNGFSPDLPKEKVDLIYLCSPNNPTGAVASKEQLRGFVEYARKAKAVILYDAAYSAFIKDANLPRSIYEVQRARECAIEINSFSKSAGFTGVRLGWTIVPKAVSTEDAGPGQVHALWNRRQCTFFNGASNIAQEGGIAALSDQGREECQRLVDYYMANARIIREGLAAMGLTLYGGVNAPYIWLKTVNGMSSWDFFDKLLREAHVVGTPGVGFGPSGEGYCRLSAFGHRETVEKAVESIQKNLRI